MRVSIIAAIGSNHAIGKEGDLPWTLPDDMAFFKEKTLHHTIITGRKNYETIPQRFRPLPNRRNIVLTRQAQYDAPGAEVVHTLEDALKSCHSEKTEIFIIGGGEIYKLALEKKVIDQMYLTEIHHPFPADAFFPTFDRSSWNSSILSEHGIDSNHPYPFTIKRYVKEKH